MILYLTYLLVLALALGITKCEVKLQIIKNVESFYTPVADVVEEKAGTHFSLLCELVSTGRTDSIEFDDQITWVKESSNLNFTNETELVQPSKRKILQQYLRPSDINKGIQRFDSLRSGDEGRYLCMSLKHTLFKVVRLYVKNEQPPFTVQNLEPFRIEYSINNRINVPDQPFCGLNMFRCRAHAVCIPRRYLCDGSADCKDASDESEETCNGDPCKDKLQCDDGRCIPLAWCCDRHHDPNCSVTIRPPCCQLLSDPYEEIEYGYVPYKVNHVKNNGGRYLFISVCILSTFFSVLLLLMILSKVVIFAKKSTYAHARTNHFGLDEMTFRRRGIRRPPRERGEFSLVPETREVSNPLLMPYRSGVETVAAICQPPAYSEVVGVHYIHGGVSLSDPPPPYTSREVLNISDDRNN